MSIIIKLFLLLYILAVLLITVASVIWMLTVIFKLECVTKRMLFLKYHDKGV